MHWDYVFIALTHRWCLGINCSYGCLMKRHVYWHQPNLGLYVNNAYTCTTVHIHNIYSCSQFRLLLHYKGNVCGVSCLIFLTLVLVSEVGAVSLVCKPTSSWSGEYPALTLRGFQEVKNASTRIQLNVERLGQCRYMFMFLIWDLTSVLKAFLAWYISIHVQL